MEDFLGLIVFAVIGIISMISKTREKSGSPPPTLPRKKVQQRQTLNRRPLNQGQAQGRKLDNKFQHNLQTVTEPESEPSHEEHTVFEHEHSFEDQKEDAMSTIAATVDYGHSRATAFGEFIRTEGQNAIVVGEILGKPKGWE